MTQTTDRLGAIIVLSGPSGAGKSTVCNILISEDNNLEFSVSCTTREPRDGEVNGINYHFISKDEFKAKIESDEFIEWAEVHGNYYGTLKSEILGKAQQGKDILLDIDIQGARLIKEACKNDVELKKCVEYVFFAPPSFEELEQRLLGRGTESEESAQRRLQNAKGELEAWSEYEHLIVCHNKEQGLANMKGLLYTMRNKTKRINKPDFYA